MSVNSEHFKNTEDNSGMYEYTYKDFALHEGVRAQDPHLRLLQQKEEEEEEGFDPLSILILPISYHPFMH